MEVCHQLTVAAAAVRRDTTSANAAQLRDNRLSLITSSFSCQLFLHLLNPRWFSEELKLSGSVPVVTEITLRCRLIFTNRAVVHGSEQLLSFAG